MAPSVELKEYIERILDEREKAHVLTLAAAIRESDAKAIQIERRIDALNELRKEVVTDREKFAQRGEIELRITTLIERLEDVMKAVSRLNEWKSKVGGITIAIMVCIGLMSTVLSVLISLLTR